MARKRDTRPKPPQSTKKRSTLLPKGYEELLGQLKERIRSAVQQVAAQIPWFHNCVLLDKLKDQKERTWYIGKTIENGWSRNVLVHWIESDLYERQGKARTNFDKTLPPPQSDLARETLKDPYKFEFLTLAEDAEELRPSERVAGPHPAVSHRAGGRLCLCRSAIPPRRSGMDSADRNDISRNPPAACSSGPGRRMRVGRARGSGDRRPLADRFQDFLQQLDTNAPLCTRARESRKVSLDLRETLYGRRPKCLPRHIRDRRSHCSRASNDIRQTAFSVCRAACP